MDGSTVSNRDGSKTRDAASTTEPNPKENLITGITQIVDKAKNPNATPGGHWLFKDKLALYSNLL